MTGGRKLVAFAALLAALLGAGWLGFLSETLMQGALGGYLALVGGNAAEHFARRKQAAE